MGLAAHLEPRVPHPGSALGRTKTGKASATLRSPNLLHATLRSPNLLHPLHLPASVGSLASVEDAGEGTSEMGLESVKAPGGGLKNHLRRCLAFRPLGEA